MLSQLVLAITLLVPVGAVPLEQRGSEVCSSGIYGELSPLKNYPIAVAYCRAAYPPQCTNAKLRLKRSSPSTTAMKTSKTTAAPTTTKKASTTTAKSTTTTKDSNASMLSKCMTQPHNVISTLCSCIQYHTPCKTTTTKGKTTTPATTPVTTPATTPVTTPSTTPSTTTSSPAAGPTCVSPRCILGVSFNYNCDAMYAGTDPINQPTTETDALACGQRCASLDSCYGFTFYRLTGSCIIYTDQRAPFVPTPDVESGNFAGFC